MDEKALEKIKKELMKPDWTENLHHALEELPKSDAKAIVESMTNRQMYQKVNIRRHQEDYISDYIEYLWEISKTAYWKHVIVSLNTEVGILWSDSMPHFEKMCKLKVPEDVLKAILDFVSQCSEENRQDFDAIGCVVKAQAEKFKRLDKINKYISNVEKHKQDDIKRRIEEMLNKKCEYSFK